MVRNDIDDMSKRIINQNLNNITEEDTNLREESPQKQETLVELPVYSREQVGFEEREGELQLFAKLPYMDDFVNVRVSSPAAELQWVLITLSSNEGIRFQLDQAEGETLLSITNHPDFEDLEPSSAWLVCINGVTDRLNNWIAQKIVITQADCIVFFCLSMKDRVKFYSIM